MKKKDTAQSLGIENAEVSGKGKCDRNITIVNTPLRDCRERIIA